MKDFLVFGTRYNKFDEIFKWISNHQHAGYYNTDVDTHKKRRYVKNQNENDALMYRYFMFNEVSLVCHEDLMLSFNTTNYTKTIVIFRDMYDVIDDILSCTFKSVDNVVMKQIDLFEEYADEYLKETNKIPDTYKLFINYNRWSNDMKYRDELAKSLGFENTDYRTYKDTQNFKLRDKVRYRKFFTSSVKEINSKVITK